jgi:hypothetical protein
MNYSKYLAITFLFALCLGCNTSKEEALFKILRDRPSKADLCSQYGNGGSIDTLRGDSIGSRLVRIAPFRAFGLQGVLCAYYANGKGLNYSWYFDSVAEWITPLNKPDPKLSAEFGPATGLEWSLVLEGLRLNYGSGAIRSNQSQVECTWKNGLRASFDGSLGVICISSQDLLSSKQPPISQAHFLATRLAGLLRLNENVKTLKQNSTLSDTVFWVSGGTPVRIIQQFDSVWNIPGISSYVMGSDSTIIGVSWRIEPRYSSSPAYDRAMSTLYKLYGQPESHGSTEFIWRLTDKSVLVRRYPITYEIIVARPDAANIIHPSK